MLGSIIQMRSLILYTLMVRLPFYSVCGTLANVLSGCRIEYLPPYSPDYQPVELAFSVIKAHLRRSGLSFFSKNAHYFELYDACNVITPEMTWGFFHRTGYI